MSEVDTAPAGGVDTYRETMNELEAMPLDVMGIFVAFVVMLVAMLSALGAVVAFLFNMTLFRIPDEHRKIALGHVWFLLVPFFGIAWLFVLTRKLAKSFESYFEAQEEPAPRTDYGRKLGALLAFLVLLAHASVFVILTHDPQMVAIALGTTSLAALIVMILYFWKVFRIRRLIPNPEILVEDHL